MPPKRKNDSSGKTPIAKLPKNHVPLYHSLPGTYLPETLRFSVRKGFWLLHSATGSTHSTCTARYSVQNPTAGFEIYISTPAGVATGGSVSGSGIPAVPVQFTRFVNQYNYRHWSTYACNVKRTFINNQPAGTQNPMMLGTTVTPLNRALTDPFFALETLAYSDLLQHYEDNPKAHMEAIGPEDSRNGIKVIESSYRCANEFGVPDSSFYEKSFGTVDGTTYSYAGSSSVGLNDSLELFVTDTVTNTVATPSAGTLTTTTAAQSNTSIAEHVELVYHIVAWNEALNVQEIAEVPMETVEQTEEEESSFTLSQLRE